MPIQFIPGVGKRTAQILHQMGVHTVGQLADIPDGVLEHIFGPSIHLVMDLARTKHLPKNPMQFSSVAAGSGYTESVRSVVQGEQLSWWKKFQLAAKVMSVL